MNELINMIIALVIVVIAGWAILKSLDLIVEQEKRKREKFKKLN